MKRRMKEKMKLAKEASLPPIFKLNNIPQIHYIQLGINEKKTTIIYFIVFLTTLEFRLVLNFLHQHNDKAKKWKKKKKEVERME